MNIVYAGKNMRNFYWHFNETQWQHSIDSIIVMQLFVMGKTVNILLWSFVLIQQKDDFLVLLLLLLFAYQSLLQTMFAIFKEVPQGENAKKVTSAVNVAKSVCDRVSEPSHSGKNSISNKIVFPYSRIACEIKCLSSKPREHSHCFEFRMRETRLEPGKKIMNSSNRCDRWSHFSSSIFIMFFFLFYSRYARASFWLRWVGFGQRRRKGRQKQQANKKMQTQCSFQMKCEIIIVKTH